MPPTVQSSTYTGTAGGTIPGQQVQNGVNQNLIAAANSTQQSGQTFSPDMVNALTSAYGNAANAATATNTPETRQAILNNTGIPNLQNNYSDLAQKLAGYDQAILKPQFEGTAPTPTTASDMPAGFSPLTAMSGLSMNNADTNPLPASSGIYNTNPLYGFQAQGNQANNILGLLGTLNDAISKEYGRGSKEYATKLSTILTGLTGIKDLLGMNTSLEMNKQNIAKDIYIANLQQARSPLGLANNIASELDKVKGGDNKVSPADYQRIKQLAAGYGISGDEFDNTYASYRNPNNPYYQLNISGSQKTSTDLVKSSLDLLRDFNDKGYLNADTGPAQGAITRLTQNLPVASSLTDQKLINFESNIGPIRDTILNAISGANVSPAEAERVKAWIPDISKSPEKNKSDMASLQNWLNTKFRSSTGADYNSGGGRPPLSSFNK